MAYSGFSGAGPRPANSRCVAHPSTFGPPGPRPAKLTAMVRPERRVVLAGESPVRVSAGAPGSRLQPVGEIRPSRAECRKPLKERGASRRAATMSERNSLVKFSTERCLGGPSRSCHGEGNRQHPGSERMLDLLGVSGGGTQGQSNAEQERPYLAAKSGKGRAYKAGRLKSHGAGRAMPAGRAAAHEAGSIHRRSAIRNGLAQIDGHGEIPGASHTQKIIVKPCAGKRHARFERGN